MFVRPLGFHEESDEMDDGRPIGRRDYDDDVDFDYDDSQDCQPMATDEPDDDIGYDPHKQVIVGICAMEKKAQSKPMKEILRRLEDYFEYIKTLVFEESVILNKPVEEWPLCDCLISFHSKGFPLSKAIEYARLRKPFLVNDLDIQYDIQDRRKVYKILEEADIELPRYSVLDRDSANPEDRELIESDDHIEVAKVVFNKPFVEKPISAEDHNICIYYPAHAGGGSQRLFRKIGCRSSVYSNESHVRKTGSYIYEEFMPTDGTDVKVYTAGPDYAHAEARKSPALDGKVERDSNGKEIRYPVILTNKEKLIARKVCLAFKQAICGFDLLRANGRSYVCDVNGFSFVKSSMKYYEDCSKILGNMMLRALAPQLHIPWSIPFQLDDPPIVPTTFGRMMELRCVIAVIRHGDRTPKQKMKLEVKHPRFFELFHKYGDSKNGQAKLKKPQQLQEVLDIARYLLGELPDKPASDEVVEPRVKLKQLKSVLEMYGHFSGINRKVQLKYQPHGRPRRSSSEDDSARGPSLVLILKWGGELTPAGRVQAEDLGRCFRRLYPASGDYSGPQGLGLLRLHSTFRHDLKIYASDEGRVQMTAAAFAKGFLALEGELTPILFQMVKSANTNGLLDNDCESSKCQKLVKERLHDIMQKNRDLTPEDMSILNPTNSPAIAGACKFIGNPYQACEKVHKRIKELNALIRSKRQDNCYTQEYHLYHGETWDLLQRRWAKLEKDFKFPKTKRFDISKIPDIYDCIKYDLQHNQHTLQFQHAHELHTYAKALADIVIPQEYGLSDQEKLMISLGTCSPLLRKIQADLLRNADSSNGEDETESVNRLDPKYSHGVSSPDRHVRTRLYFTSESHIHSLVTALQYGGLLDVKRDEQWKRSMEFLSAISELNYLSQIVIMLYEDPTKEPTSDDRFHIEIHFSSGVINRICQQTNMPNEPQGPGFRPHLHNKSFSNASSTGSEQKSPEMNVTVASTLANRSNAEGAQCEDVDMSMGSIEDSSQPAAAGTAQPQGQQIQTVIQPPPPPTPPAQLEQPAQPALPAQPAQPAQSQPQQQKQENQEQQPQPQSQEQQEQQTQQVPSTLPKPISLRNNWKAYEQYLASEWTNTPHMQRFARRQCANTDHLNLPPTYHTIHHLNFSPSTLNALAESTTSISTSTSPNTKPSHTTLHQQFTAHRHYGHHGSGTPTGGPKMLGRYATLSASMPIHYKSSQNPRACSVADVSQYCGGPSSLISTAVISGSSPELVAVCPYSPSIRPLETLHNELSLKQFIDFISRLTQNHKNSSL
jgi:inositol hexakisphosphate/diphosphoinositol-pentakisphosphate kinase